MARAHERWPDSNRLARLLDLWSGFADLDSFVAWLARRYEGASLQDVVHGMNLLPQITESVEAMAGLLAQQTVELRRTLQFKAWTSPRHPS